MGKIIAFIPVRAGSKSIPLKNIKTFCGKPLVYWSIVALQEVNLIDEIIVATDSNLIKGVVNSFNFNKVIVFNRSDENSSDESSTESVLLEYLNHEGSEVSDEDIMMLVQATSPLTRGEHFQSALTQYISSSNDSLLSCVRVKRFFWNQDGSPINYDYMNRPRRQKFKGELMENGAFYINKAINIKKFANRLSGIIGIYEMPEYTSVEIDEEDDWLLAENLMYKYNFPKKNKVQIKLFLTDVDGVLTDAGMYYSENGDELKKFSTYDGMAFQLIREKGIKVGIITSEKTKIVERRAKKLKVDYLYQGKTEGGKLAAAMEICTKEGITMDDVAYIGDDINCYELLSNVKFAACPQNSSKKIKTIPNIIQLNKKGGEGVIREFVDTILNQNA